ncbi:5-carboxymethyl-2-hydroxymuconate Delta-isomerase [Streptomyces sp. ISL-99]|uniref:5-carboxymethyl-2-hydroxymuconate Delta-isomerase n=1 Tax=Streptomyces sp. ISL-99 TaxID=2819193 RepID=UPI001BE76DA7|nr:5-carboxymethyl-2-hydroxymuconate Delta-isomerase [Streptomyces sp. ISL-99]MBT2527848.1 5-carboxymethyl-2-hydroxymuconate Delta-isomerase [Streptomyces sp. ISL-99]
MPHLVLEYSGNARERFDPAALFAELHTELAAAGGFRVQDFKSRAVRMDHYFIGDGTREQSFVNLDVRTFGGKSPEARAAISQAALAVVSRAFAETLRETACDVSVQITELDRPSFSRTRSEDQDSRVPA